MNIHIVPNRQGAKTDFKKYRIRKYDEKQEIVMLQKHLNKNIIADGICGINEQTAPDFHTCYPLSHKSQDVGQQTARTACQST